MSDLATTGCSCATGASSVVSDVLTRRFDSREAPPNLRAAFNYAERALFAMKPGPDGPVEDEDALYWCLIDVAVAAMAKCDQLRPEHRE